MAAIAVVHGVTITSPAKREDPLQPLCPCSGQETSKQPACQWGENGWRDTQPSFAYKGWATHLLSNIRIKGSKGGSLLPLVA